jgi:hypothetical protein
MRRLAGIAVVIALASAGCIGSSSSSIPSGHSDDLGLTPLKTDVTISYIARRCPTGARCTLPIPGVPDHYLVKRHLTCSPDGGDYDDPAVACRALADLATMLDADPTASHVCWCPYIPEPRAKAVGVYHGKRRTIPLDGCSLCGLPGIGDDLKLLMPGAQ